MPTWRVQVASVSLLPAVEDLRLVADPRVHYHVFPSRRVPQQPRQRVLLCCRLTAQVALVDPGDDELVDHTDDDAVLLDEELSCVHVSLLGLRFHSTVVSSVFHPARARVETI